MPHQLATYLQRWQLKTDGDVFATQSSLMQPVIAKNNLPAMLKLTHDQHEKMGYALLQYWDGVGAAKIYACDENAMMMERAIGLQSLLSMGCYTQDAKASQIICDVIRQL